MAELELTTETVKNCPLCGSDKAKFLFWNYDRLYNYAGKFGTVQCEDCGLIRLSPRPVKEQLVNYYPTDYYSYQASEYFTENHSTKNLKSRLRDTVRNTVLSSIGYSIESRNWQKLLQPLFVSLFYKQATYGYEDKFARYVPNGTALEIGCGSASYLSLLKHHGWQVAGVDLSPQAAEAAKKYFDIDVFVGELEDAPFAEQSFDYIRMSHVVEHFTNPLRAMKKIREILKPNGVAYIEVPNAESFESETSGRFWYGWDAPRHLFMLTPATLHRLVESSGLKIEKMLTQDWNSFWWDNTFKREEETGEWLETRPYYTKKDIPKYAFRRLSSKIAQMFKPHSGYNICCWVSRQD
ncbi:MAG: class I SAM-dependent methyltransferase [Pyrinomonadaceae bacterium]